MRKLGGSRQTKSTGSIAGNRAIEDFKSPFFQKLLDETMRKYPPAYFNFRRVIAENGKYLSSPYSAEDQYFLPKGTLIMMNIFSAGRSGEAESTITTSRFLVGEDADECFNPDRSKLTNFGFGHGVHACPGQQFAKDEMRLLLAKLVQEFDTFERVDPSPLTFVGTGSLLGLPSGTFKLRFTNKPR